MPCGIFDDPKLVAELKEACATVRKAMEQISVLNDEERTPLNFNQMVRWVNTKEEHCKKIITLIAEYCLCQRVKPDSFKTEKDYFDALKAHHGAMQAAMKAKQQVNRTFADALDHAIADLAKIYSPEE